MGGVIQGIGMLLDYFQRQTTNRLAGEEWKLKKEQLKMAIDERDMHLNLLKSLPPELQKIGILDKGGLARLLSLNAMIDQVGGVGQQGQKQGQGQQFTPESTPEPYEIPTGKFLPTQNQPQEQGMGLPQTIANQNLFGGMNQQDVVKDYAFKEFGIGRSQEAIGSPRDVLNPETGQVQMGVNTKGKGWQWLTDKQGNPLVVPPDAEWKKEIIGGKVIEIAYSKKGEIILQNGQPLIRMNIPQEQQMLKGMAGPGGAPMTMPVPPGGLSPQGLPEAVKGEPLTMTGPRGEVDTIHINPYTLQPITEPPGTPTGPQAFPGRVSTPGIRTKAPQGLPGETANKINQVKTGIAALRKMRDLLFDKTTGKINRSALSTGKLSIPWTEGKQLKDTLFAAIDPIQRAASGAVIRPEEEAMYRRTYGADVLMSDEQILGNWDRLANHLFSQAELMDPNEIWTPELRKQFQEAVALPGGKGVSVQPGKQKSSITTRSMELMNTNKGDTQKVMKQLRKEFSEEEISNFARGK